MPGDDFYRVMDDDARGRLGPAEGAARYFDWERLAAEALEPLRAGRAARWRPYDWAAGAGLADRHVEVAPADVVIVEGVYSARPELAALVDAAVLVTVDDTARRARLAARGHDHGDWPTRWEAAEDWYFAQCRPPAALDAVVAGA